jgi:hypothetical protein
MSARMIRSRKQKALGKIPCRGLMLFRARRFLAAQLGPIGIG